MGTFTKKFDNCVIANGVARPPRRLLEQLSESMRPTRRGQFLLLVSVRVLPVTAPASGPWGKRTALKCVRPQPIDAPLRRRVTWRLPYTQQR